jgi:nucleotide-binding universal stress UspA family protein
MFKRILVPLDGSPVAEGILSYVRTLGKPLGARSDRRTI